MKKSDMRKLVKAGKPVCFYNSWFDELFIRTPKKIDRGYVEMAEGGVFAINELEVWEACDNER